MKNSLSITINSYREVTQDVYRDVFQNFTSDRGRGMFGLQFQIF